MKSVFRFPANHPVLVGHFPGNPVIPGVLILEKILECYRQHHPQQPAPGGFSHVKFLQPLRPEEDLRLEFSAKNNNKVVFICAGENDTVYVKGEITLLHHRS